MGVPYLRKPPISKLIKARADGIPWSLSTKGLRWDSETSFGCASCLREFRSWGVIMPSPLLTLPMNEALRIRTL